MWYPVISLFAVVKLEGNLYFFLSHTKVPSWYGEEFWLLSCLGIGHLTNHGARLSVFSVYINLQSSVLFTLFRQLNHFFINSIIQSMQSLLELNQFLLQHVPLFFHSALFAKSFLVHEIYLCLSAWFKEAAQPTHAPRYARNLMWHWGNFYCMKYWISMSS